MRTFVKVILPVLAFTLASAAAVGTKTAKVEEANKPVLITGFIQNPSPLNCKPVQVDCSEAITEQTCMSTEAIPRQVWKKNAANACSLTLYKVTH
ncbi:DUF6520 domain-containing protein [Flavobacterium gelidilacus]|uniref:DUF6520 family protein n=1 Tax=Flavobacterium gelidilacus TaxID=206041 RepID=UPI00041EA39A|nr:DUF6520 family protein [Flavobacterium gelidilacus]